jgi:hypothetical protein
MLSVIQTTESPLKQPQTVCGGSSKITFFTICNATYFPGLVGLLNSLRLMGHQDRVVVADCGLAPQQRALLAPHCTLVELASLSVKNPAQFKPFPYLLRPQGTVVMIDSDMILTRNLDAVLATAAQGKICVFPDGEKDRWFCEWSEIFGLSSSLRRQTYVCSGFVVFSTLQWPRLLERWWNACTRILTSPTYQEGAPEGPTAQGDQDALNALLMSEFPSDALSLLPNEEVASRWDFRSVRLVDSKTLNCQHRGRTLMRLHACLTPKPWQRAGVRQNVYLRLLRRLLSAPDVALSVPPGLLPVWLRQGPAAELTCHALSVMNMANRRDGVLPDRVVTVARCLKKRLFKLKSTKIHTVARSRSAS